MGMGKGGLLCDTRKRGQNMSKIITCEQVSNGHPDKICDQIADAIVTDILQHDKHARVAIECLLKKSQLFIAGEVTTDYRPNYNQIVHDVFNRIGAEKLGWNLTELLRIGILVDKQSPDIALGVDKGGAGDQGIMYGYATNETAEQMPIPYMVATKFLQLLKAHPSKMFRADAKAQVSYDYDTGRITTFLCSVQHSPDVEVSDFRHIIESMMVLAACEYGLDGDFTKLVNPTGRFVLGGSYADCGVTGRKLACDTYGGIGRMGGGALSGKDPTKVDRSAAYMARKIAKDIVQAGYADKCEVTTDYRPNYNQIVHDVFNRIGAEKLGWNLTELLRIGILVDKQSPDIAMSVDKGGAGDQGIMYGYATNETAEQMPIPYMVATKFLQLLKNHPSKMFRADAKAQVSYDYDTGRITTFLCSVQHSPDVEVSDFRHIIESMMVLAACEYGLDGDFTKLVNPTGRFVLGGSYADCGVTGRKLACDTYGGIGRMGGGALSGKDPTKVDRSAAYMARKIAKDIVQAGYADKCEVQLAYAIGVVQPVGVAVECFGTEHQSLDFIEAYVHDSYDLTPQGIIKRLGLLDVDYNKVSAYGHFGKAGLPWED